MPLLSCAKAKSPAALQRSVLFTHCTVMHGCGVPFGSVNGQPAMVNVSDGRTMKSLALALLLDEVADTVPPCGHIRTLEVVRRAAPMGIGSRRDVGGVVAAAAAAPGARAAVAAPCCGLPPRRRPLRHPSRV